jgi:hypothetical protein
MHNDRKVPKHLFRPAISSVVVLVTTAIFSMLESIETINRGLRKVFILTPMI